MEAITEFGFKIILLFLPGLIAFILIDALTIHKEYKGYQILIYSLILGFLCYLSYYLALHAEALKQVLQNIKEWLTIDDKQSFLKVLKNANTELDLLEIIVVSIVISPLVGIFCVYLINHKKIFVFAQKIGLSNKIGDVDTWSYVMNSNISEWVVVRDPKNNRIYKGWLNAFSDSTDKECEIFLQKVTVYNSSNEDESYKLDGLYLSKKNNDDFIVEFPPKIYNKKEKRQEGKIKCLLRKILRIKK